MFGLDDIIGSALKIVDRVIPDPAAKAAAQLKVMELAQSGELAQMTGQMDVNKAEATNPNWFVAGWRPFVGWVCGCGLFSQFIVRPFVIWGSALAGHPTDFPSLDMGTLVTLLGGMLGLTAARTVEKMNDAAGNH